MLNTIACWAIVIGLGVFVSCVVIMLIVVALEPWIGPYQKREFNIKPKKNPNHYKCSGCGRRYTREITKCTQCGAPTEEYYGNLPLKEVLRNQG